jgi:adenosylhomocysteine nucleosidase
MDTSMPRIAGSKVAIVAALEQEVRPLIKNWRVSQREHEGKKFKFFENDDEVLVCGGIGAQSARRATEAVIALYQPETVMSVGFAGALDASWKVGAILTPVQVIDAQNGSRWDAGSGKYVLVSVAVVAGVEQKKKLAGAYGAQAVDMESAAVALGAQARGVRFSAVKVISDELDFELLSMEKFIGVDGQFKTGKFVTFAAIRPWLWPRVMRLQKNSKSAAEALCTYLASRLKGSVEILDNSLPEAHPTSGARA